MPEPLRIFVRQCLTETVTLEARDLIQQVLDELQAAGDESGAIFLPGRMATQAKYADDFRVRFTQETGQEFTPRAFENWRNASLREADLFVAVRTAMSESTAVEIGRFTAMHEDGWSRCFILVADLPEAELKTTLLRNAVIIGFSTAPLDRAALREAIRTTIFSPQAANTTQTEH